VAFFGRLSEEKAPDVFVEIARELAPNVSAVFLMTGRVREGRRTSRSAGMGSRNDDHPGFCGSSALLIVRMWWSSSRLDGMPLIALEAMNASKSVGYPAWGLPTLVAHGETGYVCEPGDVGAFCRHIERLLVDKALRLRMGAAGRDVVTREYSSKS
jgi:glycosyltransferase involved in cell wall biosynthesis